MKRRDLIVMASPDCYEVSYAINPWMDPQRWSRDEDGGRSRAQAQWSRLAERFRELGIRIETVPAAIGLPDIVFPANSGIVLDGRVLLGRFRHPERRGEEAWFLQFFERLRDRGLLAEVRQMPEDVFQEGAGDCLWDIKRQLFWGAHGPRSVPASFDHIRAFFNVPVIGLELVTQHYYHLDTCFCPLSGGEVVYYPPALSEESLARITETVPLEDRILAGDEDAAAFCLNAVNIGRNLVMTAPSQRLRAVLEERGYRILPVDLSAFIMAGGAALCMTLRLDWTCVAALDKYVIAGARR